MKLQAEIREYRLQARQAADSLHLASQRFKNFESRLMDLEAEDGLLKEDAAFLRLLRNEFASLAKERLEKSLKVQEMAHFTIPEARKELEVCELKLQNIDTLHHLTSQIEALESKRRRFHHVWGPLPSDSATWLPEKLAKDGNKYLMMGNTGSDENVVTGSHDAVLRTTAKKQRKNNKRVSLQATATLDKITIGSFGEDNSPFTGSIL
jgi:hypothetical protein